MIRVYNMPESAEYYDFIVVTITNGDFYFYSAHDCRAVADAIATNIGGIVFRSVVAKGV